MLESEGRQDIQRQPQIIEKKPHVLIRRFGDVVQAIAVFLLIGLIATVVDVRDTVKSNESAINLQDALHITQIESLRMNLNLQMGVLDEMVKRMTSGGYNAAQGQALERAVSDLREFVGGHTHSGGHVKMLERMAVVEGSLGPLWNRLERVEEECRKRIVGQATIGDTK